jgi:thioredoxin-like negative regulator of GroEL
MSWLGPVLVLIGSGLLVYMAYNYWCKDSSDNNNDDESEGVILISNMTNNNNGSKTSGTQPSSSSTGHVIDLDGPKLIEKQNEGPVIIAIMAQGCGHCTHLKPKWHEAAKLTRRQLHSLHAHSPGGMDVCKAFNIRGFPTIICIHKGKIVDEYQGDRSPQSIAQWADSLSL